MPVALLETSALGTIAFGRISSTTGKLAATEIDQKGLTAWSEAQGLGRPEVHGLVEVGLAGANAALRQVLFREKSVRKRKPLAETPLLTAKGEPNSALINRVIELDKESETYPSFKRALTLLHVAHAASGILEQGSREVIAGIEIYTAEVKGRKEKRVRIGTILSTEQETVPPVSGLFVASVAPSTLVFGAELGGDARLTSVVSFPHTRDRRVAEVAGVDIHNNLPTRALRRGQFERLDSMAQAMHATLR